MNQWLGQATYSTHKPSARPDEDPPGDLGPAGCRRIIRLGACRVTLRPTFGPLFAGL